MFEGLRRVFLQQIKTARDDWHLEDLARAACGAMKSIAGMCVAPLVGSESKLFVQNSYSVGMKHLEGAS